MSRFPSRYDDYRKPRPMLDDYDDVDEEHTSGGLPAKEVTCNRCGATGLEWIDIGMRRWRLYDGMKLHVCPDTTMHDFEDLTK